mgnify:CR=1 FL=1
MSGFRSDFEVVDQACFAQPGRAQGHQDQQVLPVVTDLWESTVKMVRMVFLVLQEKLASMDAMELMVEME